MRRIDVTSETWLAVLEWALDNEADLTGALVDSDDDRHSLLLRGRIRCLREIRELPLVLDRGAEEE